MPGLARVCACPRFSFILARAFIANSCTSYLAAAPAVDALEPTFALSDHGTGCHAAAAAPVSPPLLSFVYAVALSAAARQMISTGCHSHRLSIWLVVAPPPSGSHAEALQRVLCRVRVHFYKNILYFVYFITKNVQNARYFAFFPKNICIFQKIVVILQRQKKIKDN